MNVSFNDKTVVVTGGTKGIGKAIAECFLGSGANVIVTGRSINKPLDLDSSIGYIPLNLESDVSIEKFLDCLTSLKHIDAFVNNAGINVIDELANINDADFDSVMEVNLRGPFIICRHLAGLMGTEGGKIVNIGSIWSKITKKGRVSYIASKAGLAGLTRGLSTDLAEKNILVNAVSPGFVETELTRKSLSKTEIIELTKKIPLNRLAQANEIANFVVFLCSDLNSFMTGQNLVIDGGYTNV